MSIKFERNWEKIVGFIILLPSLIGVAVFVYAFIGWSAWVSVSNWKLGAKPNYTFSGFDAYARLFGIGERYATSIDAIRFAADMRNVIGFTLLFIASCIIFGFLLATILDRHVVGEGIFRNLFLFPMAISFIVTGLAWRWLFTPGDVNLGSTGLNLLFESAGLGFLATNWSSDLVFHIPPDSTLGQLLINTGLATLVSPRFGVTLAVLTVVVAAMWQLSGYTMALYLAGLRGISEDLREAARVDGASEWQVYRLIVIPLLKPITLSVIIILAHLSLKIYDLIVAMGGQGPGFVRDMPAVNMFGTTFGQSRFAQGAAISMVLLALVSVLIIPYLTYTLRQEEER